MVLGQGSRGFDTLFDIWAVKGSMAFSKQTFSKPTFSKKAFSNKKDLQQKNVGYFFGDTAHQLEGYMFSLLRPFGIGIEQLWVLYFLDSIEQKIRISELANVLLKDITTTSRLLSALEQKGFIKKQKDPKDKRFAYVHITESGRQKLESVAFLKEEIDKLFDTALSPDEQAQLRTLLEKISKVAQSKSQDNEPKSAKA